MWPGGCRRQTGVVDFRVWVGTRELEPEEPWETLVEEFVRLLARRPEDHGVVGWGDGRSLGAVFTVTASDTAAAGVTAYAAAEAALATMGRGSHVVRLEIEQVIEEAVA